MLWNVSISAAKIVRRGVGHVAEGQQFFHLTSVKEDLESSAEGLLEAKKRLHETRHLGARAATHGHPVGGERQMLAIGRALMSLPKLLVD